MDKKLSFYSLTPHLKNLRIGGIYKLNSDSSKLARFFHTIYIHFVLLLGILYSIQEMLKAYQVRHDVVHVTDIMFFLLSYTDYIYKKLVIWMKQDKIEQLLAIMKGQSFNQGLPEQQKCLSQTVRQAKQLLRVFNFAALGTCVGITIHPIILYAQGKPVDFAIWLPFDGLSSPLTFYLVVLYSWIQTSFGAFNNTTMDAFLSFFLAQSKTQLYILRMNLENMVSESKADALRLKKPLSEVFQQRFVEALQHYNEIVTFVKKFQDIFGGAILYQFLVSGWIICVSAYRMVHMDPSSIYFLSMVSYMMCILLELFLYCFYGNEVFYESGLLINSVYKMNWLELSCEHRRSLIIFMERLKRQIRPSTGVIVTLSNATFFSVLRSSYSFYTFLRNTD